MSSSRPPLGRSLACGVALLVAAATAVADPTTAWTFKDGDRVVFVGDTFIEREQRYGYLETVLTLANPDKDLTFRNLGWSGDTVRGLSRAGFDPPEAGYAQLKEQIAATKPTVLVFGYGQAESFDGAAGLSRFVEGYQALLDAVAPLKARLVLLAPLPHEALPAPLPDPSAHNADLERYADAVRKIAESRKAEFIDLYAVVSRDRWARKVGAQASIPDTDNGIHPTGVGYWRLATLPGVVGPFRPQSQADAWKGSDEGASFTTRDARLPLPASPAAGSSPDRGRSFRAESLKPGRYTLKVDGRPIATKTAQEWASPQAIPFGPEAEQVEELRRAIVAKNRLFFYRWRPQNITYLTGFRKHEQGRNAIEIPQFDPLVDELEKRIATLRKPARHTYELVRESEASR